MDKQAYIDLYNSKQGELDRNLPILESIIRSSSSPLEGNSFYYHNSVNRFPELFNKQVNLFWCGTQVTTRICEIGFNAGHSTLLFLLGRDENSPPIDFTIFDIGQHDYTRPCFSYIEAKFPTVNFECVYGDSTVEMPKWIEAHPELCEQYDVVHVDGGHSEHCIFHDLMNSVKLVRVGGLIIIDDTYFNYINRYVDLYLSSGCYEEVDVLQTVGYPHRIIRKVK